MTTGTVHRTLSRGTPWPHTAQTAKRTPQAAALRKRITLVDMVGLLVRAARPADHAGRDLAPACGLLAGTATSGAVTSQGRHRAGAAPGRCSGSVVGPAVVGAVRVAVGEGDLALLGGAVVARVHPRPGAAFGQPGED